jgi:cholesterol transport system auxiliary component
MTTHASRAGRADAPSSASDRPFPRAARLRRLLVVATCSWLGSGCGGLLPTAPADHVTLHMLDVRPAVATAPRRDHVLAISPPRGAPGVDSAAMTYVSEAHRLDHYATHRWADTPARMLDPLLTRALEDTGRFRAVVQVRSGVRGDLRLDTEIVRLRQSFLAQPSRVELALRAQLVDVAGARVLATRHVEVEQEAPSNDAAGGVAAANAAVARALVQLAEFCVEAAAALRRPATAAESGVGATPRGDGALRSPRGTLDAESGGQPVHEQ